MVVLVLVFLGSGFFKVGPQEQAIILRFGKPVGEGEKALLGPGAALVLPYPIDEHIKVSISGMQQVAPRSAGTRPRRSRNWRAPNRPPAASLNPALDGYVLTADENIVHARATLTYRISDPSSVCVQFCQCFQRGSKRAR